MLFRYTKACFVYRIMQIFFIYYELCLKMPGNEFPLLFHNLLIIYLTLMHLVSRIQFSNIMQCYTKLIEYATSYNLIRIFFGKYILTVLTKVEKYLWLHFISFLNHLSIYKEIQCSVSSCKTN